MFIPNHCNGITIILKVTMIADQPQWPWHAIRWRTREARQVGSVDDQRERGVEHPQGQRWRGRRGARHGGGLHSPGPAQQHVAESARA